MALDVYFKESIACILAATDAASSSAATLVATCNEPATVERVRIYRQGYRDALGAVATALGILPEGRDIVEQTTKGEQL
jgi:hypothetical protein